MKIELLEKILERIEKEEPNFERILQNKPYNSESHKKAVEVTSFELLEIEIQKLQYIRKFKKDASQILIAINNKDTNELLEKLNILKPKLIHFINTRKYSTTDDEEIISLNPNFHGFGINLKMLWRKIINH